MEIRDEDLAHLERLARVRLDDDERGSIREDLTRVLDQFARLREVDTEGLEPLVRPVHLENVLREDRVEPSLPAERALELGQDRQDGFFKVPRTLDQD